MEIVEEVVKGLMVEYSGDIVYTPLVIGLFLLYLYIIVFNVFNIRKNRRSLIVFIIVLVVSMILLAQ